MNERGLHIDGGRVFALQRFGSQNPYIANPRLAKYALARFPMFQADAVATSAQTRVGYN